MKILLDHCVPKRLGRSLPNHEVRTTREMLWEDLRNGKLLASAAGQFDVLLTVDRNMKFQQNLSALPIAVVVLISRSNVIDDLVVLVPQLEQALATLQPRTLIEVSLQSP